MADFSQAQVGGPSGSSVTPQQAVQGVSTIAGVANMGAQLIGLKQTADARTSQLATQQRVVDDKAEAAGVDRLVGTYVKELDRLANAARQGGDKRSIDLARSALRNKFISANDGRYSKELLAADKAFESVSDGIVLTTGGEAEIARRAEVDAAREAGFILPYMNDEQREEGMSVFLSLRSKNAVMEQQSKELTFSNLQDTTTKSQLETKDALAKDAAKTYLRSVLPEHTKKATFMVKDVLAQLSAGADPKGLVLKLEAYQTAIKNDLGFNGADAPDAFIDNLSSPLLDYLEVVKTQVITGKLETDLITQQEALLDAQTTRSIFQTDPSLRVTKALGSINRNFDITNFNNFLPKAQAVVASLTTENPNFNPFDKDDDAAPLDVVFKDGKELLRQATAAGATQSQADMGRMFIDNFMKQIGKNSSSITNPKSMQSALDFIADPQFAEAIDKFGFSQEAMTIAKDVYDRQYADVVYPKVFTQWNNPSDSVDTYLVNGVAKPLPPPSEYLEATENGGIIRFRIKEGYGTELKMNRAKGIKEATGGVLGIPRNVLEGKLKQANEVLAPIVTKAVRYEAHLQGRKDYSVVFNEQLAGELGMGEKASEAPAQTPVATPEPVATPSLTQQAKDAGVDLSQFADGEYVDGNGNTVVIKGGEVVEVK